MLIPDKRFLVTGGTGSFGNFIVHRLLDLNAREVRVLSRDEKKQYDMRVFYADRPNLTLMIGDVRDPRCVREAMHGVDVVVQAAALKQVSTCERFPLEAVETNVTAVQHLVDAALDQQVDSFVAISTDKAVKPVNVMGMTKALQERLVLAGNLSHRNRGTRFACVRYGNVLRSRGSVVPYFRRQLSLGQELTITDERMTRFLLTLNDAIDLVLYAVASAEGGEILIRKAPSARLMDIATVLSAEFGRAIRYRKIGILPGEKLNEVLVSEEELERTENLETYYRIHPWWSKARPRGLNREFSSADYLLNCHDLAALIARADREFEAVELAGGEFAKF